MDTLLFTVNAVFPILLTILTGKCLHRLGWMPTQTANAVNKLCFNFLIPLNIFYQLHDAQPDNGADAGFLAYGVLFILVTLALLCLLAPRFIKNRMHCGEFIQSVFRGNVSLISVSLLSNMYGEKSIQILSYLLPITLVLYNSLSVILLAYFFDSQEKVTLRKLLRAIVTNPFVLAVCIGMAFSSLRLRLPEFVEETMRSISAAGTPLALMALGTSISFCDLTHGAGKAVFAAFLRQMVIPAIVLWTVVALGFRNEQLGAYLCIACTPTATAGYVLVRNMGGDGKLTAQIAVYSVIFSFVSIFGFVFLFCSLGWM